MPRNASLLDSINTGVELRAQQMIKGFADMFGDTF